MRKSGIRIKLVGSFARIDPEWQRPTPSASDLRRDIWFWIAVLVVSMVLCFSYQSLGLFSETGGAGVPAYVATAGMTLPLFFRRRFPITMLWVSTCLFFALGYLSPGASTTMSFQLSYLVIIYTALAWAKDRKMVWIMFVLVCLFVAVWLVSAWTISGSVYSYGAHRENALGPLSIPVAAFIVALISNCVYFGSGAALGRSSWRRAYQRALLERQAEQLQAQSAQMTHDAVIRDRLRIARELHDSVGHHISVIGIQSAAARRLMEKKPTVAFEALQNIEDSTRKSVAEMKSILKILRNDLESDSQEREPQLDDLPSLVDTAQEAGLRVELEFANHQSRIFSGLSQGVQLSVFRIIQEALNNVHKHSSARFAKVVLRTGGEENRQWVELQVTDDGRGRSVASSGGFGLRGITERAEALGGYAEIGPREGVNGWSVRVRFPVESSGENTRHSIFVED